MNTRNESEAIHGHRNTLGYSYARSAAPCGSHLRRIAWRTYNPIFGPISAELVRLEESSSALLPPSAFIGNLVGAPRDEHVKVHDLSAMIKSLAFVSHSMANPFPGTDCSYSPSSTDST